MGAMEALDAGNARHRKGVYGRSGSPPPQLRKCFRLVLRQRWTTASRSRANVSGRSERGRVAKPLGLLRERDAYKADGEFRRKNDGPLRICTSRLLARRYESGRRARLQHGNEPGAGDPNPGVAREIHPEGTSLAHR